MITSWEHLQREMYVVWVAKMFTPTSRAPPLYTPTYCGTSAGRQISSQISLTSDYPSAHQLPGQGGQTTAGSFLFLGDLVEGAGRESFPMPSDVRVGLMTGDLHTLEQ